MLTRNKRKDKNNLSNDTWEPYLTDRTFCTIFSPFFHILLLLRHNNYTVPKTSHHILQSQLLPCSQHLITLPSTWNVLHSRHVVSHFFTSHLHQPPRTLFPFPFIHCTCTSFTHMPLPHNDKPLFHLKIYTTRPRSTLLTFLQHIAFANIPQQ